MKNKLCYFELMVSDVKKAKDFYTKVFDWKIKPSNMLGPYDYHEIDTGAEPSGGLMRKPDEAPANMLTTYILVESIDETLKKVAEAGGRAAMPKREIPSIGWWALFFDPDQIPIMIFEPLKK
jgi:predicted enzyme related to lactoylglutathione lyase